MLGKLQNDIPNIVELFEKALEKSSQYIVRLIVFNVLVKCIYGMEIIHQ